MSEVPSAYTGLALGMLKHSAGVNARPTSISLGGRSGTFGSWVWGSARDLGSVMGSGLVMGSSSASGSATGQGSAR